MACHTFEQEFVHTSAYSQKEEEEEEEEERKDAHGFLQRSLRKQTKKITTPLTACPEGRSIIG